MNVVLFCHSLRSDWNNGHVHFLRGVLSELQRRGHRIRVFEPADAWSARSLVVEAGPAAIDAWAEAYPTLAPLVHAPTALDLDEALDGADLVLVHEWNGPALVGRIGRQRAAGSDFVLLFHDTHHRSVSDQSGLAALDSPDYDGVARVR